MFMFSKRFFTFYSTALLAYKRNSESSILSSFKQVKHRVTHKIKSMRSIHVSRITQSRLFFRIMRVFKRWKYSRRGSRIRGNLLRFVRRKRNLLKLYYASENSRYLSRQYYNCVNAVHGTMDWFLSRTRGYKRYSRW